MPGQTTCSRSPVCLLSRLSMWPVCAPLRVHARVHIPVCVWCIPALTIQRVPTLSAMSVSGLSSIQALPEEGRCGTRLQSAQGQLCPGASGRARRAGAPAAPTLLSGRTAPGGGRPIRVSSFAAAQTSSSPGPGLGCGGSCAYRCLPCSGCCLLRTWKSHWPAHFYVSQS